MFFEVKLSHINKKQLIYCCATQSSLLFCKRWTPEILFLPLCWHLSIKKSNYLTTCKSWSWVIVVFWNIINCAVRNRYREYELGGAQKKGKVKKYSTLTLPGEITFLFALHFVVTKTLLVVLLINTHKKRPWSTWMKHCVIFETYLSVNSGCSSSRTPKSW